MLSSFARVDEGSFVWTPTDGRFARGGRNFQRTHDEAAERETEQLWQAATNVA